MSSGRLTIPGRPSFGRPGGRQPKTARPVPSDRLLLADLVGALAIDDRQYQPGGTRADAELIDESRHDERNQTKRNNLHLGVEAFPALGHNPAVLASSAGDIVAAVRGWEPSLTGKNQSQPAAEYPSKGMRSGTKRMLGYSHILQRPRTATPPSGDPGIIVTNRSNPSVVSSGLGVALLSGVGPIVRDGPSSKAAPAGNLLSASALPAPAASRSWASAVRLGPVAAAAANTGLDGPIGSTQLSDISRQPGSDMRAMEFAAGDHRAGATGAGTGSSGPDKPASNKPLNLEQVLLRLVKAAALGDGAAAHVLATRLHPSDLATLRLLQLKVEARLGLPGAAAAAGGSGGLTATGGAVPGAASGTRKGKGKRFVVLQTISLSGGGARMVGQGAGSAAVAAVRPSAGSSAKLPVLGASGALPPPPASLGLEFAVDVGMKHHLAAEKAAMGRGPKPHASSEDAASPSPPAAPVSEATSSVETTPAVNSTDALAAALPPQLGARVRQRVIRAWLTHAVKRVTREYARALLSHVRAQRRAAGRFGGASSLSTEALLRSALLEAPGPGQRLRLGAASMLGLGRPKGGEGPAKRPLAGKTEDAPLAGAGAGTGADAAAGGAGGLVLLRGKAAEGAAIGSSARRGKKRLTKLKRAVLRDRVNKWLQARPEAHAEFSAAQAAIRQEEAAVAAASAAARSSLRAAAIAILQKREDARRRRQLARGRVVVSPNTSGGGKGRGKKTATSAAAPAAAAPSVPYKPGMRLPAPAPPKPVDPTRRQLSKVMKKLVEQGKGVPPAQAGEQALRAVRQARDSAVVSSDGGSDALGGDGSGASHAPSGTSRAAIAGGSGAQGSGEACARVAARGKGFADAASDSANSSGTEEDDDDDHDGAGSSGASEDDSVDDGGQQGEAPASAGAVTKRAAGGRDPRELETARKLASLSLTTASGKAQLNQLVLKSALAGGNTSGGAPAESAAANAAAPPTSGGAAPRAYVDQTLSPALDELVSEMASTAYFFQERAREAEPRKAAAKRRLVIGLREVARGVRSGKIRAVVIAPNVEEAAGEGGLDEAVSGIIGACRAAEPPVPVLFALSRKKLGRALGKSLRVSVVGFLTFEALRGLHSRALEVAQQLRAEFALRVEAGESHASAAKPKVVPPVPPLAGAKGAKGRSHGATAPAAAAAPLASVPHRMSATSRDWTPQGLALPELPAAATIPYPGQPGWENWHLGMPDQPPWAGSYHPQTVFPPVPVPWMLPAPLFPQQWMQQQQQQPAYGGAGAYAGHPHPASVPWAHPAQPPVHANAYGTGAYFPPDAREPRAHHHGGRRSGPPAGAQKPTS